MFLTKNKYKKFIEHLKGKSIKLHFSATTSSFHKIKRNRKTKFLKKKTTKQGTLSNILIKS